jgi:hypothetical protein
MALKSSKEIIQKLLEENLDAGLSKDQIATVVNELTEKHASHAYPIDFKELQEL